MDKSLREAVSRGEPLWPMELYHMQGSERPVEVGYHWHREAEILYIRQSGLWVLAGGQSVQAGEGDVVFIHPGELHRMRATAAPYDYGALVFDPECLCFARSDRAQKVLGLLAEGALSFPLRLRPGEAGHDEVWRALLDIDAADAARRPGYELEIKAALLRLTAALWREGLLRPAPPAPPDAAGDRCKAILAYLGAHYAERLTLAGVAARFGLSPKYFSSFFTRHVGMGFVEYCNRLRVEHACALLAGTDRAVVDVAYSVGFGHLSYFIKTFRTVTGCTPSEYRRLGQGG